MPTFVKVGKYKINLDQVLYISEESNGSFVYFARVDPVRLDLNDTQKLMALLPVPGEIYDDLPF